LEVAEVAVAVPIVVLTRLVVLEEAVAATCS
jgi:hypothetical protein